MYARIYGIKAQKARQVLAFSVDVHMGNLQMSTFDLVANHARIFVTDLFRGTDYYIKKAFTQSQTFNK